MEHLIGVLATKIADWYAQQDSESGITERRREDAPARGVTMREAPGINARAISEALVKQAVENGLQLARASLQCESMSEGSTAEVVECISLALRFVEDPEARRRGKGNPTDPREP